MTQFSKATLTSMALGIVCGAAYAQTIDGTVDGVYGRSLAVQNVQTQFGDSTLGLPGWANGSEIDSIYGRIDGGYLYLCIPGNVESNYNKFEIFIDSVAGGQNRLLLDQSSQGGALTRMNDDGSGNGLTFDTAFEADYIFNINGGGDPYTGYVDFAQVGNSMSGAYLGYFSAQNGTLNGGAGLGVSATIDNSNVLGVSGGTGKDCGVGVTTGVEVAIPLDLIGNPTGPIKVCAFVNGLFHDYLSNQVIGGCGPISNLGEPRNVNFSNIPGDQYVIVGGAKITGRVVLGDLVGPDHRCATVSVRDGGGTEISNQTVEADAGTGYYEVQVPANGQYIVSVKDSHWLRATSAVVTVAGGVANDVNLNLVNGDVDGDNEVSLVDYAQLAAAFGSDPSASNWNANADLDEDGEVTLSDYSILSRNFGQTGDE